MKSPSKIDSNLILEYIQFFKLYVSKRDSNSAEIIKAADEILSLNNSIWNSHATGEIFIYFSIHGAATSWLLQVETKIPEATVYRALRQLRVLGIIEPLTKLRRMKHTRKGGPRPTVWGTPCCTKEEISKAIRLHHRSLSPKYRIAEEVAQTILEDYVIARKMREISYRLILVAVKEMRLPFKTPDIADLAAQYLGERGIKIWR